MIASRRARTLVASLATAIVASVGLVETAQAAGWETVLSADAHVREPAVLVGDRSGGALLAWVDFPSDRPTVPSDPLGASVLQTARRPPGGNIGPVTPLTSPGERPRALAGSGDGRGGVMLAWRHGESPAGALRATLGSTSTGLGAPVAIRHTGRLPAARAPLGGPVAARPAVALALRGDAMIAWLVRERPGCGYAVRAAVRDPGGRQFGPGRLVSAPCAHAHNPRVALDAQGVGAIAWDAGPACPVAAHACAHRIVVAPVRRGRIGTPNTVTRAAAPFAAALTAAASGPTIAWRALLRRSAEGALGPIRATSLDAHGRLRPIQVISRTDRIFGTPRLAAGPDGTMIAVWQSGRPVNTVSPVQIALRRPRRTKFSVRQSLRSAGVADGRVGNLQVGLDRDGAAAVVYCTGGLRLVLGIRTAGGAVLPSEPVGSSDSLAAPPCSGGGSRTQLVVSATGHVLVALTPPAGSILLLERSGPLR